MIPHEIMGRTTRTDVIRMRCVNLRLPNVLPGELNQGSESDDQKKNDGHHAVVLCDSLLPRIEAFARESKL
jgi:hypothetical protein